jgi:uncharacterized protein (TIGR02421 family)
MTAGVIAPGDRAVDREISDIAATFRFLLDVTPLSLPDVQQRFIEDHRPPAFDYRPLEDDLDVTVTRLDAVPVDDVQDPTLASLLLAKRRELRLQMEMLACRGSKEFMSLSVELYGAVSPGLLREAEEILAVVPPPRPDRGPRLGCDEVVVAARAELDRYREMAPELDAHVEVRDGTSGVMVANGDLLVAPDISVPASRIEALLHHEVGTHIVTHANGHAQPLHLLAVGLADHDETQEGLAVLAEYLVGGLTTRRLRQLAGRVVAVHHMLVGASFTDVHEALTDADIGPRAAFTITMRVFRAGGLTKDAVYLRGLQEVVEHVAMGKSLEPLLLGKMPLSAIPLVEDLKSRGALVEPLLRPRYLDEPDVQHRLGTLDQVGSLATLAQGDQ